MNATHEAVASGVDYVADEIAVLGDDLPEELRASLGDNGEDFYDSLIRGDLSSEQREAIMQDPAFLNTLMTQNELDGLSSEEKANLQADFVSKIDALANQIQANKENPLTTVDKIIHSTAGQTAEPDSEYTLAIEINSGVNNEPTVLEKAVAGMGKAQQAIMALEESNPQAAEAVRIGLGLATGGAVKEVVSYTVEKATEVAANMSETAQQALAKAGEASDYLLNLAGSFIQGSTLDEFKGELADEKQYPESFSTENGIALLGDSPTDIKDGVVLTASTLGIGAGLLGVKKASSHGGDGPEANLPVKSDPISTDVVTNTTVRDVRTGEVYNGSVDVRFTLDRIEKGESYPHRNDGSTFRNGEGRLPDKPSGYYTEYVVPSDQMGHVGPQRIVVGKDGEAYYTPDHYGTFIKIKSDVK